jgi:hypothetical protein
LRTVILWIHALSGLVWTGGCAAFVLAGSAVTAGSDEWRDFGLKVAPRLDRLNLGAAAILLLTGAINLMLVGTARGYSFSSAFVTVLGLKIGLFVTMTLALAAAWRAEAAVRSDLARGMRTMVRLSGLTVIAGTIALGLGLWLLGA